MKKISLSLMAVVALSSFGFAGGDIAPAPVVVEKTVFYVGGSLAYQRTYSADSKWFGETDSQDETGALGLVLGYEYNEYVAFEGRIATTVFEEDYADVTTYSIFVKPQYPVTEEFTVYALLGFGNTTVKATDNGGIEFGAVPAIVGNTLMDESGFQWGIGIGYDINEDFTVNFDYISYVNGADIDPTPLYAYGPSARYTEVSDDALTLSVIYKF